MTRAATNGRRARSPKNSPLEVVRDEPTPVLPHDVECEASILGGVILRNAELANLNELAIDDFYLHQHKVVWEAIRNLEARQLPIDVVMLDAEIKGKGKSEAVGGIAFLGELCLRVPTPDNVVAYRDIVLRLSKNRRAILALSEVAERAYNWQHDPSELIAEIIGDLQRITPVVDTAVVQRDPSLCPALDAFLGDQEPDDDDAEDWIIRDLVPRGEPALWGGPMKSGKTWAALDLAIAIATGSNWLSFQNTMREPARVVGIFLEDSKRRLRKRMWELCRARGTSPNDNTIREHLSLSREPIRLPDDMKSIVERLRGWRPAVILVDNLTRIMVGDPNSTRDAALFTKAWSQLCNELGATVLLLHHTKKLTEADRNADPFDSLRGSGDFGATARNIIISRPIPAEGEHVSEVRMRGNLDLRRDSFALGFERKQLLDRWQARLVDRGEVAEVRADTGKKKKELSDAKKKADHAAEIDRRRNVALGIVRNKGACSTYDLGEALGMSAKTAAPILAALASSGVLRADRKLGYVFADASAQEDLIPEVPA